jgi:hypothetical protein
MAVAAALLSARVGPPARFVAVASLVAAALPLMAWATPWLTAATPPLCRAAFSCGLHCCRRTARMVCVGAASLVAVALLSLMALPLMAALVALSLAMVFMPLSRLFMSTPRFSNCRGRRAADTAPAMASRASTVNNDAFMVAVLRCSCVCCWLDGVYTLVGACVC